MLVALEQAAQGAGTRLSLRSLQTPTILWFLLRSVVKVLPLFLQLAAMHRNKNDTKEKLVETRKN